MTDQGILVLQRERGGTEAELQAKTIESSLMRQKLQENYALISNMQLSIRQLKAKTDEERQSKEDLKKQLVSVEEFLIKAMNRTLPETDKDPGGLSPKTILNIKTLLMTGPAIQKDTIFGSKEDQQDQKAPEDMSDNNSNANEKPMEFSANDPAVGDVVTNIKHIVLEFMSRIDREPK